MRFTEEQLKRYAEPLSDTENEKCKNAIKTIRDSLRDLGYKSTSDIIEPIEPETYAYSTILHRSGSNEKIQIFIQGSYANNTCVRGESDVDIAIVRMDQFEYGFGKSFSTIVEHKNEARQFKDLIEHMLRKHFSYSVTRHNKSIKVAGNTYRKPVDTVPCFSIHYYTESDNNDYTHYVEGITIYSDDGQVIYNYPKQHISNGKQKNNITSYRYKKMVRIIKKMRGLMDDMCIASAENVSSFGLESLLWNIPYDVYTKYISYGFVFDEVVDYLVEHKWALSFYKEANGIKQLCPTASDEEHYSTFIDDLRAFYRYDV